MAKVPTSPEPTKKAPPVQKVISLLPFFWTFRLILFWLFFQAVGIDPDELEAELEEDLGGLNLDDVDTDDVNLDDEDLLED